MKLFTPESFHKTRQIALTGTKLLSDASKHSVIKSTTNSNASSAQQDAAASVKQKKLVLRHERLLSLEKVNHSFSFRVLEMSAKLKVKCFLVGDFFIRITTESPMEFRPVEICLFYCKRFVRRIKRKCHTVAKNMYSVKKSLLEYVGITDLSDEKVKILELQVDLMKEELDFFSEAMKSLENKLIYLEEKNQMRVQKNSNIQNNNNQSQQPQRYHHHLTERPIVELYENEAKSSEQNNLSENDAIENKLPIPSASPIRRRSLSSSKTYDVESTSGQSLGRYGHSSKRDLVTALQQDLASRRLRRLEIPRSPGRTPVRTFRKSYSAMTESISKVLDEKFRFTRSPPNSPSNSSDASESFESPRCFYPDNLMPLTASMEDLTDSLNNSLESLRVRDICDTKTESVADQESDMCFELDIPVIDEEKSGQNAVSEAIPLEEQSENIALKQYNEKEEQQQDNMVEEPQSSSIETLAPVKVMTPEHVEQQQQEDLQVSTSYRFVPPPMLDLKTYLHDEPQNMDDGLEKDEDDEEEEDFLLMALRRARKRLQPVETVERRTPLSLP